jgi:transposase InsO family protein
LLRRGLPRAVLSDNGTAMCAAEITEAFARLSILHDTTLSFSPYQYVAAQFMFCSIATGRDL